MTIEAHVEAAIRTKRAPRLIEEAIAELAAHQHGVVSRAQLVEIGLGASAIKRRVAFGRLQPLHRGVYAVGHRALRREAWWMAAVLAAGPGATLSYRSAAELWDIRQSARARVEVSVPRHRRSTARLEVHVVPTAPDELTTEAGIPVTTPARTLFDLAAVVSQRHLEAAFKEAEIRRLTSPTSRCPRRALRRTAGDRRDETDAREAPPEWRDRPEEPPRAPFPRPPRRPPTAATGDQPHR
jgi:predicted transcriptional regulator of viral defense system